MKACIRSALLGAAGLGLLAVALPAQAASSTAVGDTPLVNSSTTTTKYMQIAQRSENPGGGMYKAKAKKKKKKKKA